MSALAIVKEFKNMEQHKTRFIDRLRSACTSWTGKIMISLGTFVLIKTLTDANLTGIALVVLALFGILGILENNPKGFSKTLYVVILILSFIVSILLWWNKYNPTAPKPQETGGRILPILISVSQANQQPVRMTSIEADKNKSELTVTLENSGMSDISSNLTVWIGIFPFFGTYNGDHIKWIKSKDKYDIPSGRIGQFTIKNAIESNMAVVVAIEGKELANGLLLDEAGISYTWNYWEDRYWTTWKDHKNFVSQTMRMEKVLDKFKGCVHTHSIDRDYSSCFTG
jgi:hypothetical protein